MSPANRPAGFPANIPIAQKPFVNWDGAIKVSSLWTCEPSTAADVEAVCVWAAGAGYQVRACGAQHNWSPLLVTPNTQPNSNVVLVDMTVHLNKVLSITPAAGGQPAQVEVEAGCTMDDLMAALQGTGGAPGFSFPHIPAPGTITVGGVLAIDAHGSAISTPSENFGSGYGSMSNRIIALTAVALDFASGTYKLQTFTRGQAGGDDNAFLAHLGRAFLTSVTLEVIPNFNLRCQSFMNIDWQTLFAAPTPSQPVPPDSLTSFLNQSGRVEAIWYPFSTYPWLKVWTNAPTQPSGSTAVTGPYNYPFSDNLPDFVNGLFKIVLGIPVDVSQVIQQFIAWLGSLGGHPAVATPSSPPAVPAPISSLISDGWSILTCITTALLNGGGARLTPCLGQLMQLITEIGLATGNSDIWGPSKNTMIYIKDTTLQVTANGYAVSMNHANVQQAVSEFANMFTNLLNSFQAKNQYPINAPLEIRVTGLDDPSLTGIPTSPAISALNYDQEAVQNGWDVALWIDVLTIPNTPNSSDFYAQLEAQLASNPLFNGTKGRIGPEWSKGWAYTGGSGPGTGPWTNTQFITQTKQTFTNWASTIAVLNKYDPKNLFSNQFLAGLMTA
jgi:FAD/FMN-containing dehydrogenase